MRPWLGSILSDMRRRSPVQQWLDSIPGDISDPAPANAQKDCDDDPATYPESDSPSEPAPPVDDADITKPESDIEDMEESDRLQEQKKRRSDSCLPRTKAQLHRGHSVQSEGHTPRHRNQLLRDASLQSDMSGSSGCGSNNSVRSVLGARRVDAEGLLLALGFGPTEKERQLARIPDRFLQPSKVNGISTEQFIRDEQRAVRLHECGVFGYRGLTGRPHASPSNIVAKIIQRISGDGDPPQI